MHNRRALSLPVLLPVVVVSSLGTVYIWVGLNHSPASAERMEDIIEMDAAHVQPIITYTGYENLRKYYGFTEQNDDRLKIVKKMIPTGWHTDILYNEGITHAVFVEDKKKRREEIFWFFEQMIDRYRNKYEENDYRYIAKSDMDESIAGLLLYIQPVAADLAASVNERIHSALPEWPYYEFVQLSLDTSVPMDQKADRTDGMVPLSASDALLVSRMGDYYRFGNRFDKAIAYYNRALELEPHEYPAIYISLAIIQAEALQDIPAAIETLERCEENCRLSSQLPKVRQMLEVLRSHRQTP